MPRSFLFWFLAAFVCGENWPQFRGPSGDGVSHETNLPVSWSASSNIRWKTALPGPGHSSPVVWGDRIFLTAFRPDTSTLRFLGTNRGQLLVLCLHRDTGKIIWEREVKADSIEKVHPTNSPASPTPVTDGKLVYVYFGSVGVTAFDFNGNRAWEVRIEPFPTIWGSGSSPILYGNLLLVSSESDGVGGDFLLALDKSSGKTVWKMPRKVPKRDWATPTIWNAGDHDEIVLNGVDRVRAYDPREGHELWTIEGTTKYVTQTPVSANGMLYVSSGGPDGSVVMGIGPGGKLAWRYNKSAPFNSSLIAVGSQVCGVKDGGVMTCLNAMRGELLWQHRLPAAGAYYASPIAAEGRIYLLSEDGETTVIAAKPVFELIGMNKLNERTLASPAVSGSRIFIRSDRNLFAIGDGAPPFDVRGGVIPH
jgi:outer membrane protein assembly factor BamB